MRDRAMTWPSNINDHWPPLRVCRISLYYPHVVGMYAVVTRHVRIASWEEFFLHSTIPHTNLIGHILFATVGSTMHDVKRGMVKSMASWWVGST